MQNIGGERATLQVIADEPAKVEADRCADASTPQGPQECTKTHSDGRAYVKVHEEENGAAGGQECHMSPKEKCDAAAAAAPAAAESEEEPSEEVKIEDSAEQVQQETAKQRRRKKRRERLRQKARA